MTEWPQSPNLSTDKDFEGETFAPIYTTTVTVSGGMASHGRASGRARSGDGVLDLNLRMPAELGGDGQGTNPEQLFAARNCSLFPRGAESGHTAGRAARPRSDLRGGDRGFWTGPGRRRLLVARRP